MQKKVIVVVLVLMAVLLVIGLFPVHGEAKIYDSVVRLHVLANSDSEEDQALFGGDRFDHRPGIFLRQIWR